MPNVNDDGQTATREIRMEPLQEATVYSKPIEFGNSDTMIQFIEGCRQIGVNCICLRVFSLVDVGGETQQISERPGMNPC